MYGHFIIFVSEEIEGTLPWILQLSINPRNEHELSEHTSGTTELDITITELSRREKRHSNYTLDIRTIQNSLKAKQHSKCTLDIRTTKL